MSRLLQITARIGLIACLLSLSGALALAQSQASTGIIEGTVQDESGGVIPGATVTLTQTETGFERVAITDDEGRFRARLLPIGPYQLKAEMDGFKTSEQSLRLTVGATLTVRVTLQVGQITETITVTGTPQIETSKSTNQATVQERAIEELPINGRDFQSFVFLTPGTVQSGRNTVSLGGGKGIETNFQIDGADRNNAFFGGQSGGDRPPFTFSQEAVREFVVLSNGFSAEFGRSGAGLVNVVSKSGTNNFHGSVFYLFQDADFLANERTRSVSRLSSVGGVSVGGLDRGLRPISSINERDREPVGRRHQFGGSFGGPIVKDKAFFFFSTEHQFFDQPLIVDFFLDAQEQAIAPPELLALQGVFTSTDDAYVYNGRADFNPNSSNNFSFRYTFTDSEQVNGTTTGTTNDAISRNGLELNETQQLVANWNAVITPRLVNEFRFNYLFEDRPRFSNVSDVTSDVTVSGCCDLGGIFFLPIPEDDDRYQVVDNLSYSFGAHDLKFGVEYNDTGVDQVFRGNFRGAFRFGSLQDLVDQRPNRYRQFFGPGDLVVRIQEWAFFVQDDWKATPNLTINMGLRWEGQYNPENDRPNTDFPAFADKLVDDTDNWAPRLGFAWDPSGNGKTVIRGSAGIFYARTPTLLFSNPLRVNGEVTNGATLQFSGTTAAGQVPLVFNGDSFPGLSPAFGSLQEAANLLGIALPATGSVPFARVNLHALDFENPESYRFSVGFEHELASQWVTGATYNHAQTRHRQRRRDLNLFRGTVNSVGREVFDTRNGNRPFINITSDDIRLVESSAESEYDSLTFFLNKRFTGNFQFQANYTLAYNDSDDDNERSANGIGSVNGFDLAQDFSRSDNDIRHAFVFNGVLELPYGFQFSGIVNANSGRPFDALTGSDSNFDGNFFDYAAFVADPALDAQGIPTGCAAVAAIGVSGDCVENRLIGRNPFNNRKFVNVDLRITKKFNFTDTINASAFIEFFNLFNTRNFIVVEDEIDDNEFGVPVAQAGDPFNFQIGFRFDF